MGKTEIEAILHKHLHHMKPYNFYDKMIKDLTDELASVGKNEINTSEPHLPLGGVSWRGECV